MSETKVKAFDADRVVQNHFHMIHSMFDATSRRINQDILKQTHAFRTDEDKGYVCIHLPTKPFVRTFSWLIENGHINMNMPRETTPTNNPQHYGWIPPTRSPRFLDVGCGVGHKVYTAQSIFNFDAYGIDLRDAYFKDEVLSRMLNWYSPNLKQADAFKYDGYKDFDIIYFYCPIADDVLQQALEKHILEQVKPGTMIVGFLSKYISQHRYIYDPEKKTSVLRGPLPGLKYIEIPNWGRDPVVVIKQ